MAGIYATAASKTLAAGATSVDNTSTGWVAGERISLGATPAGATYLWSIAQPSASSRARSALSTENGAAPTFTPDVGGTYSISCLVDGATTYALRLTCQLYTTESDVDRALEALSP